MPSLSPPIVIAHRGASGYRPEHTLAAYALAIAQGADVIEPDLVPTRDDVLVARHENEIGGTTDVVDHPAFADRYATKLIDGTEVSGWFTEDFTLAELKTLRARERLPEVRPGNTAYDGQFEVPTFAEVLALAQRHGVGVYPETKHPTYFAGIGHPTDALVVNELRRVGWSDADAPVFLQSFEVANLRRLAGLTKVRLIQLLDARGGPADGAVASYADMVTAEGLAEVARYAWGIGPNKAMVTAELVGRAQAAGLRVHPWTYRAERMFLPERFADLDAEIADALRLGVDGFFTDFPDVARRVVGSFE
jgi:glycerophosphoryl diester phosphodiesterase